MPALATIAPFGFSFDPGRLLRAYRSLGCTRCQFYRNEANPPSVRDARAIAEDAGLSFDSIHGVFGFHVDPTSPDRAHRKACVEIYRREGELTRELGGTMVVVHPAAWNPDRREMTREEADAAAEPRYPRLDEFLGALAEIGPELGIVYLIENQPLNCPIGHDARRLAQHVLAANSPAIRMCLDTGHGHMTGDVAADIRACAPAISYLHVHDNDARHDDHRMPGDGTIDWQSVRAALRDSGVAGTRMLEVFYDEARVEAMARNGLPARLADVCAL